ncbi:MAG: AAA family ATPase [Ruminococcus sp.]|nr:AAA family ATPase [Ruminococcus sp.]
MWRIKLLLANIRTFPAFLCYVFYDFLCYFFYRKNRLFYGWGIHLFTGRFGAGKTSLMVIKAYELCKKYPQLTVITNLKLTNFPEYTHILPLNTAYDILNAPKNSLILIDEIGTIFNSRDFSSGKRAVPKPVFQHLSQCRHRKIMILGTVQRFNLLDKQIRDISATVTECHSRLAHPFSRKLIAVCYDISEYEALVQNPMYIPRVSNVYVKIQTDHYRHLYDTMEMVSGFLGMEYISDEEILRNQGSDPIFSDGSKEGQKNYKKSMRRRR